MSGVLLAFIASIILVIADAGKKKLSFVYSTPVIVWNHLLVAITVNMIYLITPGKPFEWRMESPQLVLYGGISMFLGELTFMRSLRSGDFSLSQPFKAFLPVMAIPLSMIILNEYPSTMTVVGVCICTIGAWLMFISKAKGGGILEPFKMILRDPAPQSMILSGFFGAFVSCMQRLSSIHNDPLWFFTVVCVIEYLFFTLYLIKEKQNPFAVYIKDPILLIGTGILWGLGMTAMYVAFAYTEIVNVYVVGQLQPLIALGIAYFIFREGGVIERIIPTLCMIAGVIVVLVTM